MELAGGDDPEQHAAHDESLERLLQALARLPESTCRALVLHRFEGLRYADIARQLGVSVSMVEKHISAALVVLRDFLEVPVTARPVQRAT